MDRPLAPRRPSLKDVDFTVPTLEQQLKQVTDGPTVEKVEAPVNPYIEALIPGLEEAPQGDAVSPDLANVSKAIRDLIGDVDVKTAVSYAKEGGYLLKHCRNRLKKPHDRLFWVDMEVLAIRWTSPQKRKKASETIIYLTDVDLILPGEDSDYFKKRKKEERALGIELVAHTSKLRVVCKNYPEWRMWLRGLLYAHQKALTKRKRTSSLTNEYIRKIWLTADQDNSGSIQFNELIDLLQQLHVQMDLRYAEKLFCSYDEDGSHVLEYDEFKQLLHRLLTHEDILVYFDMFKHSAQRVMTAENYQQFLLEVQKTPPSSIPDAMKHLNGMGDPFRKNKNLTDWGFSLLLTSEANSIIHPNKQFVYQEMNRPLHEYWVASSHNTYLTGDQVSSKSSVGQYIDVLLKGCRCVELDCWDGPYGEPIIYHGHTLTKKISFSAVLQACKDYGFKKSSYPIILSLEMHCSARQKARVGQLLVEILGHQIYTPDPTQPLASPESLQNKFIVKGRVPDDQGMEIEEGDEEELLLLEREMKLNLMAEYPDEFCLDFPFDIPDPHAPKRKDKSQQKPKKSTEGTKSVLKKNGLISEELRNYYCTISLAGKALTSFDDPTRLSSHICSMSESKFRRMSNKNEYEVAQLHLEHLTRVFPSGTRLSSSNFNPISVWNLGSQIVALNYQVMGLATLLNMGRFVQNGNCGYVLKPNCLRNPAIPFTPSKLNPFALREAGEISIKLRIRVLAAQQLPRPASELKKTVALRKRDAVSPYVVVTLQGVPPDCKTFRTHYVQNNGLNPRWQGQMFSVGVSVPSLAIMVFEVRHYDSVRSEFLAAAAFPVSVLRPGLRWVPLVDAKFRHVPWSGILVMVEQEQLRLPQPDFAGGPASEKHASLDEEDEFDLSAALSATEDSS